MSERIERSPMGSLRRRMLALLAGQVVLALAIAGMLLAALAVVLDLVLALPAPARQGAWWVLGAALLAVLGIGVARAMRLTDLKVARACEARDPALGTGLTNAVQLARAPQDTPVGESLRREAVTYGREKARRVSVWPVVKRGVVVLLVLAVGLAAGWLAAAVLAGPTLRTVAARFAEPTSDHPPVTRLKIELARGPGQVLYGSNREVHATVAGAPAETLVLYSQPVEAGGGGEPVKTTMFRRPDGSFFQTLANLREPTRFWAASGRARSEKQQVDIIYTPQIERVELIRDFPDYTGLGTQQGELAEDSLKAPRDTRLTFRLASNRPLQGGELLLTPLMGGEPVRVPLEVDPDQPRSVRGGFELDQDVVFALSITDEDGIASDQPRQGRILIDPDRRPRLHVMSPGRDALTTPDQVIPVHVQAEDDYGVEQVVWFRGLNRSSQRPSDMPTDSADAQRGVGRWNRLEVTGQLDLADLGVRPGDTIEYFFEARDNDPHGPNLATSRPFRLQVISQEQYRQIMLSRAGQERVVEQYVNLGHQLRRLVDRLNELGRQAARAEQGPQAGEGQGASEPPADPEQLAREWAQLGRDLQRFREQIDKAMSRRPVLPLDEQFQQRLGELTPRLDALRERMAQAGDALPSPAELEAMARELGGIGEEVQEHIAQPAEQFAKLARIILLSNKFIQLTQDQGELTQLARPFRDRSEDFTRLERLRLQELSSGESDIARALHELIEGLKQAREELPEDPALIDIRREVEEFVRAVDEAQIEPTLNQAAEELATLDGIGGYRDSVEAYRKMQQLIRRCGMDGSMGGAAQMACTTMWPSMSEAALGSLSALGGLDAGRGGSPVGGSGSDGYALLNQQLGLFGPDFELPKDPGGGLGDPVRTAAPASAAAASGAGDDPDLPTAELAGRVELQRQARFPLRYRDLVGEYFRAIAESAQE